MGYNFSDTRQITGVRELSLQLSKMGAAAGGKALRSAVMSASLPALNAAIAAAPVGNPPYKSKDRRGSSDPYPKRTYKGRLVIPGFLKSQIRRRSYISNDKTVASVRIAPTAEAFYGVNFIEFGTAKIAKRPWLEPSFRASVPDMAARLKERLKALIDKAARSK
jgi:hypothetical protein